MLPAFVFRQSVRIRQRGVGRERETDSVRPGVYDRENKGVGERWGEERGDIEGVGGKGGRAGEKDR